MISQKHVHVYQKASNLPFLTLKVRYPAVSYVIGFSLLLGVVIVMNSNVGVRYYIHVCCILSAY